MDAAHVEAVAPLVRRGLLVEDEGPSLADVRRARVPFTDAEAATLAVPLAEALDALHDAGLAYGPPAPRDVRFLPAGRPALVVPSRWADEPDDDIPGLLRTVLGVMTPALPPCGDDEAADDEPDLRPALEALLARGCRRGAEVVAVCFGTVEPEPIRMPDAGALAGAAVLEPGGSAPTPGRQAPRLPRGGRRQRGGPRQRDDGAGRDAATPPLPVSRRQARGRARRRSRLRIAAGALAALAVVVGGALLRPGVDRADAGQVRPSVEVVVDPVLDRQAPAAAAAALTRARAELVGAGDAARLVAVDATGGPALDADEDLVASLDGDALDGLSVDVQATELVDRPGPDEAAVAVTAAMSPYRRTGSSGAVAVPGTAPRTVVLHLRWDHGGWRVWSVDEPAATL